MSVRANLKSEKSKTKRGLVIDKHLQEISHLELITAEEEVALAKRIRNGDEQALEKLIKSNLRFVVTVAKRYQDNGLSLNDLISEGHFGLRKAAKRFDETRGFKFITYAISWIEQSIMQALSKQARIVHIPSPKIELVRKIDRAISRLEQLLGRDPILEEIAEEMKLSRAVIKSVMGTSGYGVSIDAPIDLGDEDSTRTMADLMRSDPKTYPEKPLMNESLRRELDRCMSTLTDDQRTVTKLFHGIGVPHELSVQEIAEKMEINSSIVNSLRKKALQKLRKSSGATLLKTYLG